MRLSGTLMPDIIDEEGDSIEEEKMPWTKIWNYSNATDDQERNKSSSSDEEIPTDWKSSISVTSVIPKLGSDSFGKWTLLIEGDVKKRSTLYIYRQWFLVLYELDGVPKLEYWYKSKGKIRGSIPLTPQTIAKLTDSKKFEIHGGEEVLYFKEPTKISS